MLYNIKNYKENEKLDLYIKSINETKKEIIAGFNIFDETLDRCNKNIEILEKSLIY